MAGVAEEPMDVDSSKKTDQSIQQKSVGDQGSKSTYETPCSDSDWDDVCWDRDGTNVPECPMFPAELLYTGAVLGQARVPPLPMAGDPTMHLMNIRQATMRQDDIVVAAYPESRAERLVELLHWIHPQQPPDDAEEFGCVHSMLKPLEHMSRDEIESKTVPRIFITHLSPALFPIDIVNKNIKITHIVRNPKDVAVSLYHKLKGTGDFTFQQFLDIYLNNQISFGHQFFYLEQMKEFQDKHQDQMLEIHYENLIKQPVEVIEHVSDFLRLSIDGSVCDHILTSESFANSLGLLKQSSTPALVGALDVQHRPGAIGEWKKTLTMSQDESFNFYIFQATRDLKIKFSFQ